MLILTRRHGESIRIGDNIEVMVLPATSHNQVKLAITAPANIHVHRKEIYDKIVENNNITSIQDLSTDIRKKTKGVQNV